MIVVPIVIAAIRTAPPITSQRIGPLRKNALMLEAGVPVAIMGLDHCRGSTPKQFVRLRPIHSYFVGMETTLVIWVNAELKAASGRIATRPFGAIVGPAARGASANRNAG